MVILHMLHNYGPDTIIPLFFIIKGGGGGVWSHSPAEKALEQVKAACVISYSA
jgi:hypothetical protein